jgi:hypothetical protein
MIPIIRQPSLTIPIEDNSSPDTIFVKHFVGFLNPIIPQLVEIDPLLPVDIAFSPVRHLIFSSLYFVYFIYRFD